MSNDDPQDRTVTKPQAKVYIPPEDSDATVIRPAGATRFNPTQAVGAPPPRSSPDMGNHHRAMVVVPADPVHNGIPGCRWRPLGFGG